MARNGEEEDLAQQTWNICLTEAAKEGNAEERTKSLQKVMRVTDCIVVRGDNTDIADKVSPQVGPHDKVNNKEAKKKLRCN